MATPNRASLINRLLKVVKKHYKPVPVPKDRTLFEHLVFACLVENSPHELAEQVLNTLKDDYFDWNEVRVSTLRELTEVTKPLVDSAQAAERLKQTLHSVFEGVYQFDLELLSGVDAVRTAAQTAAGDPSGVREMILALDALDGRLAGREAMLSGIQ